MHKHKIKNKRFGRTTVLTTLIVALVFSSVSTTIAFLIAGTESIVNVFVPAKVSTEVVWIDNNSDDGYTGKNVRIKNTSDIDIYIRAAFTVNWVKIDEDGNRHVYSVAPKGCRTSQDTSGFDYTINDNGINDEQTWIKKEYDNGEVIYYFKAPVSPNDITTNLFSQFKELPNANKPEGYELEIEVVASGIQAIPKEVAWDKWKVNIDENTGYITGVRDENN